MYSMCSREKRIFAKAYFKTASHYNFTPKIKNSNIMWPCVWIIFFRWIQLDHWNCQCIKCINKFILLRHKNATKFTTKYLIRNMLTEILNRYVSQKKFYLYTNMYLVICIQYNLLQTQSCLQVEVNISNFVNYRNCKKAFVTSIRNSNKLSTLSSNIHIYSVFFP